MKSFNLVFGMFGVLMVAGLLDASQSQASGMFIPPRPNALKAGQGAPNPPCAANDDREVCKKEKEKSGSGASDKK